MPTQRDTIIAKAIEILLSNPQGVRYSELERLILADLPTINKNSIGGVIWNLDATAPEQVYKADRGLFRHVSFREELPPEEAPEPTPAASGGTEAVPLREIDFYQSFADYLKNDIEEVSKAIPLGGNKFRDKWGTPDVIGITKPLPTDIIKEETVIVSSEIKMASSELITAFGQACAYKIFSHKVYLVIPKNSNPEDKSKIESLCLIFGMGLILFDNTNKNNPQYEIRVRALRHEPDMWYVNKFMKLLETDLFV